MQRKSVILIVAIVIIVLSSLVAGLIFFISVNTHNHLVDEKPKQMPLVLELTQSEVKLKIGDSFNAKKYIKSAKDKNGKDLVEYVKVFEKIETAQPGEYIVIYKIINEENGTVLEKELKVIVR